MWKHNISTTSSLFLQKCDEAYSIMLCFMTQIKGRSIWMRLIDLEPNKWSMYKFSFQGFILSTKGGVELVYRCRRSYNSDPN